MSDKPKSILDDTPIVDEIGEHLRSPLAKTHPLEIVGHCPSCGAPVYGTKYLSAGAEPVCKHSCQCPPQQPPKKMIWEVK